MSATRTFLVRMPAELHEAVRLTAEREDRSMSQVVRAALRAYCARSKSSRSGLMQVDPDQPVPSSTDTGESRSRAGSSYREVPGEPAGRPRSIGHAGSTASHDEQLCGRKPDRDGEVRAGDVVGPQAGGPQAGALRSRP